jgi:hypothetical protein
MRSLDRTIPEIGPAVTSETNLSAYVDLNEGRGLAIRGDLQPTSFVP